MTKISKTKSESENEIRTNQVSIKDFSKYFKAPVQSKKLLGMFEKI